MLTNTIVIILARGGSKGIPNKNIIDFCGKPLLVWSIEQAKQVKSINSVWVSSDSEKILNVAKENGANVIKRPMNLSEDTSTSESGWLHALDEIEKNHSVDLIIGMQPTSPLRESDDIQKALIEFDNDKYDSMFSGAVLNDFLIWKKNIGHIYESFNYDYKNRKRRQDTEEQIVENGSFYIFKPEILRNQKNRLGGKIGFAKMEFWKTFEIDSLEDLELCKVLMRHYLLKDRTNA